MPGERIRPSAVVILYRTKPALEVFLVERSLKTRFFPGYHAFPGGVLDAGESDRARAAMRELAEETGVQVDDPARLRQAATLVTPPFAPTRYDTTFYVCEMPPDQEAKVDGEELVSGRWIEPREALRKFAEEAFPIPPPTLAFLRMLDLRRDPARVADEARALDGQPHHLRFKIEMHPGVYALPLRAPTLPPATTQNCWVLDGDPVVVVDPGTPREDERASLFHTLDEILGRGPRTAAAAPDAASVTADGREVLVVLTHHHADHVASAQAVKSRYRGATVLAHPATMDALPRRLVDEAVEDGHVFDLGKWGARPWRLRALHTPGHTAGHLALRDERFGAIFAGDLVSGVSTILIDPEEGDMAQYMQSLRRCADLKPSIVLPGHGPALPGSAFAKTLEHRKMREQKALAALGAEARDIEAMVPQVYDDTPQEAWGLAARSLESILVKLEREGKARREGEGWRSP